MPEQSDQLELLLQQYADGELHGQPLHDIEQLLAHDPQARQTVAHYRKLSSLLASSQPATDFEQQVARINFEIDRAETAEQHVERSRWQIGRTSLLARTFAVAAAVTIVASVGLVLLRTPSTRSPDAPHLGQQIASLPSPPDIQPGPAVSAQIAVATQITVTGPMAAVAQQVGTVMVHIGPPSGSATPQGLAESESIVVPTGRVVAWTDTHSPPRPGYLQ